MNAGNFPFAVSGPVAAEVVASIGQTLIARGKVLKSGKTLVVSGADVFIVHKGVEKLCAIMQQTLFVIKKM